jgi:hypothetical protein
MCRIMTRNRAVSRPAQQATSRLIANYLPVAGVMGMGGGSATRESLSASDWPDDGPTSADGNQSQMKRPTGKLVSVQVRGSFRHP